MISLLKPILDNGFSKKNEIILWISLEIVFLIFFRGITSYISSCSISWVSSKVVMTIRRRLFEHIMQVPVAFFDQQSIGTLLTRVTYDVEQVADASSNALIILIRETTSIIALFITMFYYSWKLSLILLLFSPIVLITIHFFSKKLRNFSKKMQNNMDQVTNSTEEMLKGHKEILIFGGQKLEQKRFEKISNRTRQQNMKLVSSLSIFDPIIQFILSLVLAFILYISSLPKIICTLSPGIITVIFSCMIALMRPLKSLTNINTQFQKGMISCQTIFTILDQKKENDNGKKVIECAKGYLEFYNVNFTYPGSNSPVLHKINLKLSPGKMVGLVGKSGSGKSTLVKLLTRFYDIKNGSIFLDGYDLRKYQLRYLRNQFALVSQDIYLFNDTIANNISYAFDKRYNRNDIEKAAEMAHAIDFIKKMKNGFDTIIGKNGAILSGGQKQRIAIARALFRKCPILILDEATSTLDNESEYSIKLVLNKICKNRTLLVIAHRLSTIEKADEIIVLEDGLIIEKGTHNSLLKKNGKYSQLYKMQYN
ncbi:fused lipid transporter subunits of ABCsuperfamily: membrane component/ATP-binding component [Candidatus Tachikawaea gelatinosa]|uniref:Fused lipid transporter subunits of ABCsuperfamily: membrane component/ATP-binding component n=1 Tax=Candidatus Tachikawaea gelatinosa TaxID=1410383 RepID=A0A090AJ87_9ENTR|nr:fused lipid transporter subunits of ABCsuperfamily: membrane component/ATP-binding component [Candidatus Tachikawaea gelatinosa]